MLGKKKDKEVKRGPVEGTIESVIEQAMESLPATQRWVSFGDLRKAAVALDGSKKRPKR